MTELELVTSSLERAARRLRLSRALRGLWFGLLLGSALWLVVLAVFKLAPIPPVSLQIAALVAACGPLIGLVIGGWRKPSLTATARWVDVQQNLKERMSTALEVAGSHDNPLWRELVVHDAASHAAEIDARRLVPLRLTRAAHWTVLLLAITVGLGFVPEYRSKQFIQRKADQELIKDAGRGVANLTRRELAARPTATQPVQHSLEQVAALGDKLERAELTRADALKDLASIQDRLKEQLRALAMDPALQRLNDARRQSGNQAKTAGALQQQIEALQKQLGGAQPNADAMEKLQQKLEQAQQAAKGLSDKSNPAAAQQMADAMQALSKQAGELGISLPNLDQAIQSLAGSQVDQLVQNLDATFNDLEKLRDAAEALQSLKQQMEQMGRNLAEQLERGQADSAQATLQKMMQQLRSSGLPPGEMQKMIQEVSKAMDPAKPYGQCAQHLADAARQMQQGNQAGAAEALAQAAKELEDLAQQMADAQQLAAVIDALKAASQCVGSSQDWNICYGNGRSRAPTEPGKGIGSQASENVGAPLDAPPDLNPDLTPTKIKGQFSAGAPMPSITLPGVSIKGTSRIQFEEAATAAQTDAESALSQDKVPRAYQGPVKDYFDDLKK